MKIFSLLVGLISISHAYDAMEVLRPVPVPEAGRVVAALASSGRLYALDQKKGVLLLFQDAEGKSLKTVTGSGSKLLSKPGGLAIAPDGSLFVADTGNSRIQIFDGDGNGLGVFGAKGSGPGQLKSPESVAVAADGRVYVADTGNHRIQVFTKGGVFLFSFGSKGKEAGQFRDPMKVAVDLSDFIYVLDAGNDRIQKFDLQAKFVKEFKRAGVDFAVDDYGFLYTLDAKKSKVSELNPDGFLQGSFGSPGSGPGQFKKPRGLSVSSEGELVVADTGNGRLQRVKLSNKAKLKPLPLNLATKILVSGPTSVFPYAATALAGFKGALYAYLPKPGRFIRIDEKGQEALSFGKKSAKDASATKNSRGFAASPELGIYVADTEGHRVQRFDLSGGFQGEFAVAKGLFASKKKEGRVKAPSAVAVTGKGVVYVADTGNRRIQAFNKGGDFLFGFGPQVGSYELKEPIALAWDEQGFLYILDSALKKVFKCEPSGGFVLAWGEEGDAIGQFRDPAALAYDGQGYLYVLDKGNPRVSVFDPKGRWITNFFARGADERSLKEPSSLAIMGNQLAISDPSSQRVLNYTLHQYLAPPVSISTQVADGVAWLKWSAPEEEASLSQYRIYRSTGISGPYAAVGTAKLDFKDTDVVAYERYYYRVAAESQVGDVGPFSSPVELYIAGEFNRAPVEISSIAVGNIFSANYKWYLTNPLGSAVLTNNVNVPFHNVKVSFRLKDFMDFATETVLEKLEPKQRLDIPLMATLNNRILEVTEDTPIQAEFTLTYYEKGRAETLSRALPLKVYSRNAITWEDPKRIATFITPKDPPVLELSRQILLRKPQGPAGVEYLNENLVIAMHIWNALGALGVKFLPSPNNPFEKMSQDPAFPTDYTQFPRETLRRKSGECDDLTTLIASMLEASTVRVALLDYPGHLALMLDMGSSDPSEVGIPEEKWIRYDGSAWVPLEATLLGSPFEESVRKALYAYQDMAKKGKVRIIDLRQAWQSYSPATMPATNESMQALGASAVSKPFESAASTYLKERHNFLTNHLKGLLAKDGKNTELLNQLGIAYFEYGKTSEAQTQFQQVLAVKSDHAGALNNLGNLAYLEGKYPEAQARYQKAADLDVQDPGIWMNLARVSVKLGNKAEAKKFTQKAVALDESLKTVAVSLLK